MPDRWVITFESVYYVMKAEKMLKEKGWAVVLIPVPRHISSDCGIAIEMKGDNLDKVKDILEHNRLTHWIYPDGREPTKDRDPVCKK
jgi:hypothetical protein